MPRPGTPPPDPGVGRPSPSRRSATSLPPSARLWSSTGAAAVALLLLLAAATTGPPPLAASRLTVASPRARQLPPQLALKLRLLTPPPFPPIPLPPYLAPRNTSLPSPGHSGRPGSSVAASATMAAALARPSLPAGPWVWTHTQRTQAARDVGSPSPGVPSWWTAPEWGDERTRRLPRQRSPTPTPTPSTSAPPLFVLATVPPSTLYGGRLSTLLVPQALLLLAGWGPRLALQRSSLPAAHPPSRTPHLFVLATVPPSTLSGGRLSTLLVPQALLLLAGWGPRLALQRSSLPAPRHTYRPASLAPALHIIHGHRSSTARSSRGDDAAAANAPFPPEHHRASLVNRPLVPGPLVPPQGGRTGLGQVSCGSP
jgi:hypothetical protein